MEIEDDVKVVALGPGHGVIDGGEAGEVEGGGVGGEERAEGEGETDAVEALLMEVGEVGFGDEAGLPGGPELPGFGGT